MAHEGLPVFLSGVDHLHQGKDSSGAAAEDSRRLSSVATLAKQYTDSFSCAVES